MGKVKSNKLLSVFAVIGILILTICFGKVSAATPNTINVQRAEVLSDLVTNHEYGFVYFTTTDGDSLYCLDNLKKPLTSGQSATLTGEADDGILYILQNGYPAKSITGNDEMDKYITQAAIWWYMDDTNQGDNQLSDEFRNATTTDIYGLIPDYITPLVEQAKKAKDNQVSPSLEVNVSGTELSLTSDEQYYESSLISVSLSGANTYNISLSGGTANTAIVDENGNAKTTFNANEQFKVRIPASELTTETTLTINVTAAGSIQKAQIFKPSDNAYQRVVGLYNDESPVQKTVNLTASPNTTSIEVDVPNTSANIVLASVGIGVLIIIIGVGIILYRGNKANLKHKN